MSCYRCNGRVLLERGNATYGEQDEWVCLLCGRAQTPGKSLPIDANLPPRNVVGYMGTSSKMRTCMDCKGPLSDRNATNRCAVCYQESMPHRTKEIRDAFAKARSLHTSGSPAAGA